MSSSLVSVQYKINAAYTAEAFTDLLRRSTLAERRPVEDAECIKQMVQGGNLAVTAWQGKRLVGIARSVTDFAYCCYLSDLAVDHSFQGVGVGRRLVQLMQEQLECQLPYQ